jgi:hypothetical protein
MNEEKRKALVVRPSTAVEKIGSGAGSVLSPMLSDALVLARSHSASLASARFRVGKYEFREADHQQILLWADVLKSTPEKIIETLEETKVPVHQGEYFEGFRYLPEDYGIDVGDISFQVKDGSISSLVWDNETLPLAEFEWVKDLNIW